jgi:predicted protein tyrosine phosphatase
MRITVSAFGWARRHKRDFEAVITLEDPDSRNRLRFNKKPHPAHLVLQFVDLDSPAPTPHTDWPLFRVATDDQVQRALDFGRDQTNLLVHCHAGIGRSGAIGLALWAQHLGPGREPEALQRLLEQRPEVVPNLHVTEIADRLRRQGKLLSTLTDWDNGIEANQKRRTLNRRYHFLFHGVESDEVD